MVREERTIVVTVISATDLKKVKKFGREQKCYVVAYIYPARREKTPTDFYGGVNPIWNAPLKVTCYETDIHPATTSSGTPAESSSSPPSAHMMTLEIYSRGGGILQKIDKLVGTVTVPLQHVASAAKAGGAMPAFEVHLPTGEVQGSLNLSVKLGAKRQLSEYEDLSAAVLPSYANDQEAPPSIYPPASDKVPRTQPDSHAREGQSTYGNYLSASDYPKASPNKNTFAAEGQSSYGNYPLGSAYPRASPNKNTFAAEGQSSSGNYRPTSDHPTTPPNKRTSAAEDDVVTGYPAPGYAFAPLGQLPMKRQQENGLDTDGHGPYVTLSPERTRRERRRKRRRGGRGGPIRRVGILAMHVMTLGMGLHRRLGASNQAEIPSSSSQPGKTQDYLRPNSPY